MMLTPQTGEEDLRRLEEALLAIPQKAPIGQASPAFCRCEQALSIREAALSPAEVLPAAACAGRILADATVGCPPAVPIAVCGERLTEEACKAFAYYGIEKISVAKE